MSRFEFLLEIVRIDVGILLISDTKLDEGFSQKQYKTDRIKATFILDHNVSGGGTILPLKEGIQAKVLATGKLFIEDFCMELNLTKQKCLISYSCNPKKTSTGQHFEALSKSTDLSSLTCRKIIFTDDFNACTLTIASKHFCDDDELFLWYG